MPLLKGFSPEIRDENTQELLDAGHPEDQAVAIAQKVSLKGAKVKNLKRPTLHPKHPFNNAKAPDNRRQVQPAPSIASKVVSAMPKPFTSFMRAPKVAL